MASICSAVIPASAQACASLHIAVIDGSVIITGRPVWFAIWMVGHYSPVVRKSKGTTQSCPPGCYSILPTQHRRIPLRQRTPNAQSIKGTHLRDRKKSVLFAIGSAAILLLIYTVKDILKERAKDIAAGTRDLPRRSCECVVTCVTVPREIIFPPCERSQQPLGGPVTQLIPWS